MKAQGSINSQRGFINMPEEKCSCGHVHEEESEIRVDDFLHPVTSLLDPETVYEAARKAELKE